MLGGKTCSHLGWSACRKKNILLLPTSVFPLPLFLPLRNNSGCELVHLCGGKTCNCAYQFCMFTSQFPICLPLRSSIHQSLCLLVFSLSVSVFVFPPAAAAAFAQVGFWCAVSKEKNVKKRQQGGAGCCCCLSRLHLPRKKLTVQCEK